MAKLQSGGLWAEHGWPSYSGAGFGLSMDGQVTVGRALG